MKTSIKYTFSIMILLNLSFCTAKKEQLLEDIDEAISREKFSAARELIFEAMKIPRENDRLVSGNRPSTPRMVMVSADRDAVIYTEDDLLVYDNPGREEHEELKLKGIPEAVGINGRYAVVSFPVKKGGCRMIVRSVDDEDWSFESGARVSCKNTPAVSAGGKFIYYFMDGRLFREKTEGEPAPEEISLSVKLKPPVKKVRPKYAFYAFGDSFLLFHGNAGSYNLYVIDESGKISKISENILSTMVFPALDGVYIISGSIGKMRLRKVSGSGGKIKIDSGFHTGFNEMISWQISKDEFISGNTTGLYYRKLGQDLKRYPVIYERFWVLKDQVYYENAAGKLYLSDFVYTDEDWNLVKLLEQCEN